MIFYLKCLIQVIVKIKSSVTLSRVILFTRIIIFSLVLFIFHFGIADKIYSEPRIPFAEPLKGRIILGFRDTYFDLEKGKYYKHTGIDIKPDEGREVYASGNGIVSYTGISPIGGKTIVIKHNEKIRTTYLNLSEILVVKGQKVFQGQTIGKIGASDDPSSIGEHLHFGVIYDGKYLDPRDLLSIDYRNISRFLRLKYYPLDFKIDCLNTRLIKTIKIPKIEAKK